MLLIRFFLAFIVFFSIYYILKNNGIITIDSNINYNFLDNLKSISISYKNEKKNESDKIENEKKVELNNKIENEKKVELNNKIENYTKNVYLDISINGLSKNIIEIELFDKIVPKTSDNFRSLCKQKMYVNTPIHRIISDKYIHTGDFTHKNGTGGRSIYGETFDDENFELKHDSPCLLTMANRGPNTNNSQFYITLNKLPELDNKNTIFGKIINGFEIIKKIKNIPTDFEKKPSFKCIICDCGLMEDLSLYNKNNNSKTISI